MPLLVWNYTPIVQFGKSWGDYPLLRQCRGLVTDLVGNIVLRPYEKFFNYSEYQPSELPIGAKNFIIETKLDGSLIIVGRYQDQLVFTTRGSFYSDQAIMGSELFQKLYSSNWIDDGLTYCFELIGPSNRIVNYYENDDLVLHGVLNTQTGLDVFSHQPWHRVKQHEVQGEIFGDELYDKLLSLNIPNEEGFVVKVQEPGIPTWICKIKFSDYCRLHKLITNFTNISVWECLANGTDFDNLLESVPDEFYEFVRVTKSELEQKYNTIEKKALLVFETIKLLSTRKEQAIELTKNNSDVAAIVFKMLDVASYESLIWKILKPTKRICPFEDKDEG